MSTTPTTPKYVMKIMPKTGSSSLSKRSLSNPNNMAEARVARKKIQTKEEQLRQAVAWCKEHRVRGYSVIKSGLFPLVKNPKMIDSRLDGKIVTGEEKRYCSVLTAEEEIDIVENVKNNNRAYQGINRGDLTKIIIDTLKILF